MDFAIEFAVSDLFQAYLQALCSTQAGYVMDATKCPIVSFYDPMSIDDADRLTVMCPHADTDMVDRGRFAATVEVGLKTLWKQPTIQNDFSVHRQRLNDVRDKLMPLDILDRLTPYLPAGIALDFVQPVKNFDMHIAESTRANWIYSGTKFGVTGFFTA